MLFLNRPVNPTLAWPHAHLDPKRVLIVESEPDAAEALATLVAFWGHQPHVVEDFRAALEVVPRMKPDAVVAAVPSDQLDGWRLAKKLHQCVESALLVGVSTWSDTAERQRLRRAGFDYVLERAALCVGLRGLLEQPWRRDEPSRSKPTAKLAKGFRRLVGWVVGKAQLSASSAS